MIRFPVSLLLCASLAAPFTAAHAGGARTDDGGQALKRMQYMLKQLNEEKGQLELRLAELEQDLKARDKELKQAEDSIADKDAAIDRYQSNVAVLNRHIDAHKATIDERDTTIGKWQDKYRDLVILTRQYEAEIESLNDTVARRDRTIEQTEDKNLRLYQANTELMRLFEDKSAWDSVLQDEPVTGLKQVEIETILQEYRFKLEDNLADAAAEP